MNWADASMKRGIHLRTVSGALNCVVRTVALAVMFVLRLLPAIVSCMLVVACGSGGDGDGKDLAAGKVFDQAELQRCLRAQSWRIEPGTESGVDFTTRSRSGLVSADVGVEQTPADAETREDAWKQLATDNGVENIDDYYFRYGNVIVAFERVPSQADRGPIERCLS